MPKISFAAFVWAVAIGGLAVAPVGCKPSGVSSHPGADADVDVPPEEYSGTDPDVPPDAPLMFDSPIFNFDVALDVKVERPPLSLDAACAANSQTAKQVPLDMYIMFDQSTSMASRWQPCVDAVKAFIGRPSSAGLGVGIQY